MWIGVTIKEMEMKAKTRRKAVGVFMGDLALKERTGVLDEKSWIVSSFYHGDLVVAFKFFKTKLHK